MASTKAYASAYRAAHREEAKAYALAYMASYRVSHRAAIRAQQRVHNNLPAVVERHNTLRALRRIRARRAAAPALIRGLLSQLTSPTEVPSDGN